MTTTEQSGGAIAVRESSGAAIVKAVPIPAQLQELGVRIAEEEDTGLRVIVLPPSVRQAVNLLTPVSSWNQADPNWTPSISLVQLDEASHTYPLPGGKKGLNKQALETLGKCAGVLYTKTARVPNHELQPGEDYAYRATVGFRRSDGTVDEVTRERGFNREAEMADIEGAVRGSDKYPTVAMQDAEIRKRWIAELRFGPAKTESKAINRALRAGLAIPASVDRAALAKPFLVIGFNFTPDYNDPEQKAALIQIAHLRSDQIYGGREVSDEVPELAAGDVAGVARPAEDPSTNTAEDGQPGLLPVDEQGGGGDPTVPVAQGPSSDGAPAAASSPEPELEPALDEPAGIAVPAAAIDAAAQTVIASKGKTIAEILSYDTAPTWVAWALANLEDGDERAALELVVQHRAPELWAAHAAEAAA